MHAVEVYENKLSRKPVQIMKSHFAEQLARTPGFRNLVSSAKHFFSHLLIEIFDKSPARVWHDMGTH